MNDTPSPELPALRGALALYAGARLVRYGAVLIAYAVRLERSRER